MLARKREATSVVPAIRQFAVILALGFWLGGLTFYSVIVIPVGTRVLGSSTNQGYVTQQVTQCLNWVGVGALAVLLWNVVARAQWGTTSTWIVMAVVQAGLFALHSFLDGLLNTDSKASRFDFYDAHRLYLLLTAAQWCAGIVHIWYVLGTRRV